MTTRRELLLFAVGAIAVPLAGKAQQARVPRVGVLGTANPEPQFVFFRDALRELGYVEGQSVHFEIRSSDGKADSLPALAADLVRLNVDLIAVYQTPSVHAAKKATSSIPIVMVTAGDPVATGLIASLPRPGGNITGNSTATAELGAKILEIIRELRPATRRVGVLANATDPFTKPFLGQIQAASRGMGVEILPAMVRRPEEFDAAFAGWAKASVDAVIVQPSLPRQRAIDLAMSYRLPSVSPNVPFVEAGGLIAYSANPREIARKAARYVDRILKGAKPADLPVEQPTTFDVVVNMKTARALGLAIPQTVLLRANRVIE